MRSNWCWARNPAPVATAAASLFRVVCMSCCTAVHGPLWRRAYLPIPPCPELGSDVLHATKATPKKLWRRLLVLLKGTCYVPLSSRSSARSREASASNGDDVTRGTITVHAPFFFWPDDGSQQFTLFNININNYVALFFCVRTRDVWVRYFLWYFVL